QLTAGAHDVSVFKDGYGWVTMRQVNSAMIPVSLMPLPTSPGISEKGIVIQVPVANQGVGSSISAIFTYNGVKYFSTINMPGNPPTFVIPLLAIGAPAPNAKVGQTITGTLVVEEFGQVVPGTPQALINATTPITISAPVQAGVNTNPNLQPTVINQTATFGPAPAAQTILATVNQVTLPTSLTNNMGQQIGGLYATTGGRFFAPTLAMNVSTNFQAQPLSGSVLKMANIPGLVGNTVGVQLNAYSGPYSWYSWQDVVKGSTTNVVAKINTPPMLAPNQVGATLTWTPASGTPTMQQITIQETWCWDAAVKTFVRPGNANYGACNAKPGAQTELVELWIIDAPSGVNTVTLPNTPFGLQRQLVVPGGTYDLTTSAFRFANWSYEQALIGVKLNQQMPQPYEDISYTPFQTPLTWTR
ncbi:hypothetical protein D6779_06540, partial [Candidatus Parcubacteria bacterium]